MGNFSFKTKTEVQKSYEIVSLITFRYVSESLKIHAGIFLGFYDIRPLLLRNHVNILQLPRVYINSNLTLEIMQMVLQKCNILNHTRITCYLYSIFPYNNIKHMAIFFFIKNNNISKCELVGRNEMQSQFGGISLQSAVIISMLCFLIFMKKYIY